MNGSSLLDGDIVCAEFYFQFCCLMFLGVEGGAVLEVWVLVFFNLYVGLRVRFSPCRINHLETRLSTFREELHVDVGGLVVASSRYSIRHTAVRQKIV